MIDKDEILRQLDSGSESFDFPMLDNGYNRGFDIPIKMEYTTLHSTRKNKLDLASIH